MNPETFRQRILKARTRWDYLIDNLTAAQIESYQLPNGWTLKLLIAHMTWYEQEMVALLQSRVFAGSPFWELPHAQRNEAINAAAADVTTADLLQRSRQYFAQFAALAEVLTAAELLDAAHFKDMPADWRPWELIAENSFIHYEDHLPELQELVAGQTS
jgi:hypothetical protein